MSNIEFILVIALAIPLWMLYHKVFVVFYRDVFWGIIGGNLYRHGNFLYPDPVCFFIAGLDCAGCDRIYIGTGDIFTGAFRPGDLRGRHNLVPDLSALLPETGIPSPAQGWRPAGADRSGVLRRNGQVPLESSHLDGKAPLGTADSHSRLLRLRTAAGPAADSRRSDRRARFPRGARSFRMKLSFIRSRKRIFRLRIPGFIWHSIPM